MKKSIGFKKIKIAVFISGTGSNLKNLINHSFKQNSRYIIKLIISNESKAKGLIYAKKFKIQKQFFDHSDNKLCENKILKKLKKNKIELICLAGFMKILSTNFIKSFNGKILNIHPSLLPRYKGLNTHQRVINNKEKYSGCTVHYVNSKLDSGKIILQKKVRVLKNDSVKSLSRRVLKQEHILFPKALNKVLSNF